MLLVGTGLLLLTGARLTVYNQNPALQCVEFQINSRIHKLMIHSGPHYRQESRHGGPS
jgi:hypothetical protein